MARKVNKSQEIRDTFGKLGNDARPKDVVAALAERRIKVTPTQVSNVKTKLKADKMNGKSHANGKAHKSRTDDMISLSGLRAAKTLVQTAGSIEAAREALNAFASLG